MSLKPLDDRIVVKPNEAEQTTASGLVIPDTAKEKPQQGSVIAEYDVSEFTKGPSPLRNCFYIARINCGHMIASTNKNQIIVHMTNGAFCGCTVFLFKR